MRVELSDMVKDETSRCPQQLSGLRVLDISEGAAGGYCTRLLAGLGADVVKVERPEVGDDTRRLGPFPNGQPEPELSALHLHLNAGKKSVTLDCRNEEGRETLLRLLSRFDVLVDSFSEQEASSLRLTQEDLRGANPRLHIVSVTPWGRTGPYSGRPGNELTIEALGGFACLHGDPPHPPLKMPGWQMECFAGTHAAIAALAAILDEKGGPHHADVASVEAVLNAMEPRLTAWEYTKALFPRASYTYGLFYPLNIWPCKDGHLALTLYYPRDWDGFALLLGDEELREDERFQTGVTRLLYREEFDAKLGPLLGKRTMKEVFEMAVLLRSATGMVLDADRLLSDPHLKERSAIAEVEHPVAGCYSMPAAPFITSEGGWRTRRAPCLGEHNAEVLTESPGAEEESPSVPPRRQTAHPFRPLEGVRVLDLSTAWAAPYTNRLLGAFGADVIKVESCVYYDVWRGPVDPPPGGLGEYADNDPGDRPYERAPLFGTSNRNKRAISLDLSKSEGREVFIRLLKKSDAVVSNLSARVLPNLGLDYETLRQAKPDIIMLAMPAYGMRGPYMNGIAYGSTIEAMAGFSARFGYKGGMPTITHELTYGDPVAGAHAAFAVLAALLQRRRTGRGTFIDLSQQETLIAQLGEGIVKYTLDGKLIGREGCKTFAHAPHGYYPCRGEDQWIAIAVEDEEAWSALCSGLGNRKLAIEQRFATNERRLENQDDLDELLAKETAGHDKMELAAKLAKAGVMAAPVLGFQELRTDPHIVARQAFEEVDHPEVGRRILQRIPIVVDGKPLFTVRPTPLFAQHNREVYEGLLGMSQEQLDGLAKAGVMGDRPLNPYPVDAEYYGVILGAVDKWIRTKGAELAAAAARGDVPTSSFPVDPERYQMIIKAIEEWKAERQSDTGETVSS